ncbi:MAG: hypothetical protein O3C27_13830 [Actinomycetota bacterium]|nr:hypothetical protein [Actinomycetota bacterium]
MADDGTNRPAVAERRLVPLLGLDPGQQIGQSLPVRDNQFVLLRLGGKGSGAF